MSVIREGDENLHYCDNSHRWIAPPDVSQAVWEARLRIHQDLHRRTMGGPVQPEEMPVWITAPRQRPRPPTTVTACRREVRAADR